MKLQSAMKMDIQSDEDVFALDSEEPSSNASSTGVQKVSSFSITEVLENVIANATFSELDVSECVVSFLKAEKATREELVKVLSSGLGKLIAHEHAKLDSVESLFHFLAKVAIKCYTVGCDLPLCVIRQEVDGFSQSLHVFARCRACMLLSFVFRARTEEIEACENENSEGFRDSCLPSSLSLQWASLLCERRLDKDPKVRRAALIALSDIPCKTFFDSNGNLSNPRAVILGSLHDGSAIVRESAIKLAPLATENDIEDCLQYLLQEDTISGQLLMAGRIAKSVHISSYKALHLEQFLKFLFHSQDSAVKGLAARQLIPFWLSSLREDWDFQKTFGRTLCLTKNLPAYPTSLFNYLDILKYEDICVDVMTVSFSHFMDYAFDDKADGVAFINFLKDTDEEYRDNYRIHDKDTFAECIKANEKDLYYDLFAHRCLVQFVSNIYRAPHLCGPKDIALSRLLPNVKTLSDLLLQFLKTSDVSKRKYRKFFCVRQICAMIRLSDSSCPIGKKAWRDALCHMISEPSFTTCPEVVEFAVHEVLENVLRGGAEIEEFTSWLCYTIFELIPEEEENQAEKVDFDLYNRCAVMLNSVLHYAAIEKVDSLMKNAFMKLINKVSLSTNVAHRTMGCNLIGLVCTLDDFLFQNYVHMLRHSIEIDVEEVKVSAILALTDVIISRSFDAVARFSFPECSQLDLSIVTERLSSTLERTLLESSKKHEANITENLLRLMYCTCHRWPTLIGTLLYKTYVNSKTPTSQVHVVLDEFLRHFMQRGPSSGMQLISGYLAALDIIDDRGSVRFCFGLMSTFVISHLEICPSMVPGFDGESQLSVSLILVLLFAMLERISNVPDQMSSLYLAQTGLNTIHLSSVHPRYLAPLRNRVESVYKIMERNHGCEERASLGMQKFLNHVQKASNDKNVARILEKFVAVVQLKCT